MFTINGKYTTATVMSDTGDPESIRQITQMVNSPSISNPVVIMPDFHAGKGSVVGFTMKAGEYICPNIVGVDIGCGMLMAEIDEPKFSHEEIDFLVRKAIPTGFNTHQRNVASSNRWTNGQLKLCDTVGMDKGRFQNSIGTLGGGNHFIEFGMYNDKWIVTIHSGSRNFGKVVAEYYQALAVTYSKGKEDVTNGLEYLPFDDYIEGMYLAQKYAGQNRNTMLELLTGALGVSIKSSIESVHNFIGDDGYIRKGATNADVDSPIILPFNRRDGIWVMIGKGNDGWNNSAPHGAGRVMSRGEAKRKLGASEVKIDLDNAGVFSSYDPLDEAPDAYKTPEEIQRYINETADFLYAVKPIINIKG